MMLAAAIGMWVWSFATHDHNLVSGGDPAQWAWEIPTSGPGGSEAMWCTQPQGHYLHEADDTLTLPAIDLEGMVEPTLVIEHWYDVHSGDSATLEWYDGHVWQTLMPVFGYPRVGGFVERSDGLVQHSFDLQGLGSSVQLRLRFRSDASGAEDGWYLSSIGLYDGDVTAPRLELLQAPVDTQELDAPYRVSVEAEDDSGDPVVTLHWAADGGIFVDREVDSVQGLRWDFDIPAQDPGTEVSWYVTASDGQQESRYPEEGFELFRVFLAAPTDLALDQDRAVGTEVDLRWTPPDSPHPVLSYIVEELDGASLQTQHTTAVLPVQADGTHSFTVTASYEAGLGNVSEVLDLDLEVPVLQELRPDQAWQGDRVRLHLSGQSLYLLQGDTELDLGQGIELEELAITDINHAQLVVSVDEDAPVGVRDLVIDSAQGVFTFPEAFEVDDGAQRPHVVSVSPSYLTQGEAGRLTISASRPFASLPEVDPGEGIVVTSAVSGEGEIASFDILVDAETPPGERILVLDDGERLWAAPFEVSNWTVPADRRCGHTGGSGWLWLLTLLPVVARRRG